jgi:hypothetical protein
MAAVVVEEGYGVVEEVDGKEAVRIMVYLYPSSAFSEYFLRHN